MKERTLNAIRAHAAREYENERRECCGLVLIERGREVYVPCTNAAVRNPHTGKFDSFSLPAAEYAVASDRGEIVCVVHSHPDEDVPQPTLADRVTCEGSGVPWLVMGWPSGAVVTIEPDGYEAPLIGRPFFHGTLDCWALIRDWYRRELGIALPDFPRVDGWWDDGVSDLYRANYRDAGFADIPGSPGELHLALPRMKKGDVILMQIRSKNGVPNHAAVYVGDGQILHHCYGRLSSRDVYGGYWSECTRNIIRYRRT